MCAEFGEINIDFVDHRVFDPASTWVHMERVSAFSKFEGIGSLKVTEFYIEIYLFFAI